MIKKVYSLCILVISVIITGTIVVQALGIDIVEIARQRVNSYVLLRSAAASQSLEEEKIQIEEDTLDYIEAYKQDIDDALSRYTSEEVQKAADELRTTYDEVTGLLESEKENLLTEAKLKIKTEIDKQKAKVKADLDKELEKKIKDNL